MDRDAEKISAGLTVADVGVSDVSLLVLVVERLALLAVVSGRVVKTVFADPPADVPRRHVHGHVKVTRVRVVVAVALWNRTRGLGQDLNKCRQLERTREAREEQKDIGQR